MSGLYAADGTKIPPTETELKAEKERQAQLALRVWGAFEKPVTEDDLLSVGVNLLVQVVFNGETFSRGQRFEKVMTTLQAAMLKGEELFATKAAAETKLRGSQKLQ